ncbi:MAG: OadG family protein [Planctomycetaceae bacterium]|nr:OadG family protein [Planctomycetales bacterium]MCB9874989.1 OadG family protein [Planctomycetaceae bacterium]HRX80635.1 OadG family transporter subunit [Pirellulaceae bacterium]
MLGELTFKFQNILDHEGFGVALTGLAIVFTSLALITLAIAAMPKVLAALEGFLPPERDHHATPAAKPSNDEAVAVAIGFAMHTRGNAKDNNG